MTRAKWDASDEPFFHDWNQRRAKGKRSLRRAGFFAELLGLDIGAVHPLVIAGSKGKGTAATFAAATARSVGARVGLITSPGFRSNRERIRLDGCCIPSEAYSSLSLRVKEAVESLDSTGVDYLSPTGAFTIAGITWLRAQGCEMLVVEAGLGGRSDESSLTNPSVVAFTEIFEEHLGILGNDTREIAWDKAGLISPDTRSVLSLPQTNEVTEVLYGVAESNGLALETVDEAVPARCLSKIPTELLRRNALLGIRAAKELNSTTGSIGDIEQLEEPLGKVRLPGRTSVHKRDRQVWVVDCAINAKGLSNALGWCEKTFGRPSSILLSIPDSKNLQECVEALPQELIKLVVPDAPHLEFAHAVPTFDGPVRFQDLDLGTLGDLILAVGTVSFVGEALDLLGEDMTCVF